jgi:ribose transport system substrate-binding protein
MARVRTLRFVLLALLALVLPILAACGATPSAGTEATAAPAPAAGGEATAAPAAGGQGPFTIGISNGFVGSEWRTQMIQNLQDVNAEYKAAGLTTDLVIESADTDVPGQIQQIRNLISKGVNAIIINPNDIQALNPVIKEAKDAGIVVITIDQEITSPDTINVVIDQKEWAKMSAQWLADKLGGKGNVVVINGIAGHPANEARYDGVKEVFAQYPDLKVLNVVNANWDQATGQQKMAELLSSQTSIDGIWTQDGMASGVLRAVMAANPSKFPVEVGEARAEYLKLWDQMRQKDPNWTSYGVINPPGVAASGLRVAVELLQGRQLKDELKGEAKNTIYVPIPGFVDQSNFDAEFAKYKDKPDSYTLDGILTADEAKALFK